MNKQIVVSFSGGRTSAYLCNLIKGLHGDAVFVFMDTGAEHQATYDFVRQCNDYFDLNLVCLRTVVSAKWKEGVSYRVIDIDEIGHDLQPWRDMSLKYGLPYKGGEFCTDTMKTTPCKKYLDDTYGAGNYHIWLGMRIDEPRRTKPREGFSYLADISEFEKQDILDWWAKMPFDLQIKEHLDNCVFCIKKGINKVALAAKDEPELASKFIKMINMDDVRIVESRTTPSNAMYRQNMSLESIIDLYGEMPRDKLAKTIRSTFETGSCSESCEAFSGEQTELVF
jgi:hypothetical protein